MSKEIARCKRVLIVTQVVTELLNIAAVNDFNRAAKSCIHLNLLQTGILKLNLMKYMEINIYNRECHLKKNMSLF